MKRYVLALSLVAATTFACINLNDSGGQQVLVVSPVLDSVFVGDQLAARSVFLIDAEGQQHSAGTINWSIVPESVATINAVTGQILGVSRGPALVIATRAADGFQSAALVVVSRPLEMTLQLDTIYLMPTDTITVPLALKQKTPGATTRQFDASPTPSVYTIDATTGLVSAQAIGGPVPYRVHLSDGTNTVSDSGAIVVMSPTDTLSSGKFYMTAFGTGIRHQSGGAYAVHYPKLNGKLGFELVDTVTRNAARELVLITLRDSVLGPGTFEIDSIGRQEVTVAGTIDPYCNPKRPWAAWSSSPTDINFPAVVAYSHGTAADSVSGQLIITQHAPAVDGGAIVSGRYLFRAQRRDLYGDPLGSETIRGTFVAPLRLRNICTA